MGPQSSLESLRELMARQGVEPTDGDLEAVQVFFRLGLHFPALRECRVGLCCPEGADQIVRDRRT